MTRQLKANDRGFQALQLLSRRWLIKASAAVCAGWILTAGAEVNTTGLAVTDKEVTVGILHSVTGTMAISETGSVQAEKLAIKQINEMGGVLGRQIKYIQEDGASDWPTFAEKSRKLLVNDKVAAVFGCWTSASRKAVLPIFEQYNGMLYYPTFYEGLEQSPNVIYTGQEATQQILAGIDWVVKEKGAKSFICWARTISGRAHPTKLHASISKSLASKWWVRSITRWGIPSSTA